MDPFCLDFLKKYKTVAMMCEIEIEIEIEKQSIGLAATRHKGIRGSG